MTKPTRTDTTFSLDAANRERLDRLEREFGGRSATIREALLQLELQQSYVRHLVHNAVIAVAAATVPDEQYDPADDPRSEEAVSRLAALLGSVPAAQGVLSALRQLGVGRGGTDAAL